MNTRTQVAIIFLIGLAALLGYAAPHSHTVTIQSSDWMFCEGSGPSQDKGPTEVNLVVMSSQYRYPTLADAKVVINFKNGTWDKYESLCKNWTAIQEIEDGDKEDDVGGAQDASE